MVDLHEMLRSHFDLGFVAIIIRTSLLEDLKGLLGVFSESTIFYRTRSKPIFYMVRAFPCIRLVHFNIVTCIAR
jgi:hypothetical protein